MRTKSHTRTDGNERPTKKVRVEKSSHFKSPSTHPPKSSSTAESQPTKTELARQDSHIPKPKPSNGSLSKRKSTYVKKVSKLQEPSASFLPKNFKIVVGTYEKLLYGLEGSFFDDDNKLDPEPKLTPLFIFPAHVSCLKAVAASPLGGKWLATGSADEIIKVWDLRRKKEIGGLIQHRGTPLWSISLSPNISLLSTKAL